MLKILSNIRNLGLPEYTEAFANSFKTKVREVISLKKDNPENNTFFLESEIDQLVYQLYGLTEEEIEVVEGNYKQE